MRQTHFYKSRKRLKILRKFFCLKTVEGTDQTYTYM